MPNRVVSYKIASLIKTFKYAISYLKLRADYPMSRTVFYYICENKSYKNVALDDFGDVNVSLYLKTPKIPKVQLNKKYITDKRVNDYKSGVYIIQNMINNKCYVGSSVVIRDRLFWHYNMLIKKLHPNMILQNSVAKYGINNFVFIPILNTPIEYCRKLEQFVKDKSGFNCCYNIAKDCELAGSRIVHSDSTKLKISIANKGKKRTEAQKKYLKHRLSVIKNKDTKAFSEQRLKNLPKTQIGSKNANSKLNEDERDAIIQMINCGFRNKDIVKSYPLISNGLITEIKSGRTWRHLQDKIIRTKTNGL